MSQVPDTRPCPPDANEMIFNALDDEVVRQGFMSMVHQDTDLVGKLEAWARDALWGSDATLAQAVEWAVDHYRDELRREAEDWCG